MTRLACVGMLLYALACTDPSPGTLPSSALAAGQPASRIDQASGSDLSDAITAAVRHHASGAGATARNDLEALYPSGNVTPLWLDRNRQPTADAREALGLFRVAASEGLDAADYSVEALERQADALARPPASALSAAADFDVALSANTLRYLRDLHNGRVDPRSIGFRMTTPADDHDFAALLRSAVADHRVAKSAAELAPPLVLYRSLRAILARYRTLSAGTPLPPLEPFKTVIHPGEPYAAIAALRAHLLALGDLAADPAAGSSTMYEGAIVQAMERFQMRHGLLADGIIGRQTHAALQVPLTWRVRQIELALERLRWLPHLDPDRFLAVNIPMFHVWVWNSVPADGAPAFGMDVIVGRALHTQTPVFVEEMQSVIFRPYWNVPSSILRGEILPRLERDPGYLQRQNMEIVAGQGDDARPLALNEETLSQLRSGRLRIRQRPGPANSLGLVKFVFPNDENIYMHGTPSPQLFGRPRRDFSHGCIRLADPVGLAEWVLAGEEGWDREAIVAAMNGNAPRQVMLKSPIQVIIFYVTAVVMPEDGTIRFADDIYRHDERLNRALTSRRVR